MHDLLAPPTYCLCAHTMLNILMIAPPTSGKLDGTILPFYHLSLSLFIIFFSLSLFIFLSLSLSLFFLSLSLSHLYIFCSLYNGVDSDSVYKTGPVDDGD